MLELLLSPEFKLFEMSFKLRAVYSLGENSGVFDLREWNCRRKEIRIFIGKRELLKELLSWVRELFNLSFCLFFLQFWILFEQQYLHFDFWE